MSNLSRALGAGLILLLTPVNADISGFSFFNHQPPSPFFPATPISSTFPSTASASLDHDFGVPAIGDDPVFTPSTAPGFVTNIPIADCIKYVSAIAQDIQEGERYFTPFTTASYDSSDSDYDSEPESESESESEFGSKGLGYNYFYDSEFDMYTKVRHHLYQSGEYYHKPSIFNLSLVRNAAAGKSELRIFASEITEKRLLTRRYGAVTTSVMPTPISTITTGGNAKKQALATPSASGTCPLSHPLSQPFPTNQQCKILSLLSPRSITLKTPSLPRPNDRDGDFPTPVFTPQALAFTSAFRFLSPVKSVKRPIHLNRKLTTNPGIDQTISPLAVTLKNADYAQFHPDKMWRDKKVTLSEAYMTLSEKIGWVRPVLVEGNRNRGCRCEKIEEVDTPAITAGASLSSEEECVEEDVKGGEQLNRKSEFRPLNYRFYAPPSAHQVSPLAYNSYTPFHPDLQGSTDLLKPHELEMGLVAVKQGLEKEVIGLLKEVEKAWRTMLDEDVKGRDPGWCNTGIHG